MIALSWDGRRVPAIADALGCSEKAVRYRLARFTAEGLDGLGDRPGAGRKPRIGQAQRSALIALVASPPPGRGVRDGTGELVAADPAGAAVWTLDALTTAARAAGIAIARSQVRRILLAEGVRWRRPRSWAASADPQFGPQEPGSWSTTRPRRRTPRSSPPTSSPPVMPRTLDPPTSWSPDGHRPKAPLTYSRGPDKTWIYGGLRIGDGQAVTLCAPSRNSASWQEFLARLEQTNPTGTIAVITDNLSSHSSLATRAWLAAHPRIVQVFIPKGACWLHPAGGLVADLPPARPGRADLRRPGRDHPRHTGGHRQLNSRAKPWVWDGHRRRHEPVGVALPTSLL
jgi:transposase